jgi:hypothetical protein
LNETTKDMLRSLFNKRRIGGKHTEEANLFRRIKHLPRGEQSAILTDWEYCVKNELVLRLKKTGEFHVSINPEKLKEVFEIIQ